MNFKLEMMMKRILIFMGVLFWCSGLFAQQQFDLDQAIEYAMAHKSEIRKAQIDVLDAEAQIKEIRAIGMPKLNAGANYQRFLQLPTSILPSFFPEQALADFEDVNGNIRSLSYTKVDEDGNPIFGPSQEISFGTKNNLDLNLEFSMLLFEGSYIVGLQTSKLYKSLTNLQLDNTEYELRKSVTEAFYNLLVNYEVLDIINQNIANLSVILEENRAIYDEGFIEKLDIDRLVFSLTNLELEKDKFLQLMEINKNLFKFSIGYPMLDDIEIEGNIEEVALNFINEDLISPMDFNFMDRVDYQLANQNRDVNKMDIKRYRYQYFPTVSIYGNYAQTLQGDKFSEAKFFPSFIVGAQLSIPIYDGRDKKSKIERAEYRVQKLDEDINELERGIALEIKNSHAQFQTAKNTYQLAQDNLELAENIFGTSQIKYREGVGSSLEVRQSQMDLYSAQQQYIQALYDIVNVRNQYLSAIGQL